MLPEEPNEAAILKGYRFGVWAQEPRQAQLALNASYYTVTEMTLDMVAGMRAGKLVVILLDPVREGAPPDPDSDDEERPVSKTNLSQNVMGLKADLMIALTRVKMPLQQASALKVGDLIDLNLSSMARLVH